MKNPKDAKERNLIKGALRRVFSRSNLRREALAKHDISFSDPLRPRVTRWSWCGECGILEPTYKMEVDHKKPVIEVNETMDDLTWDELIGRIWCDIGNLSPVCKDCHKIKTKKENKERREYKRSLK
jgi:5-methylcytosine-specific restriction endonuclease McrA